MHARVCKQRIGIGKFTLAFAAKTGACPSSAKKCAAHACAQCVIADMEFTDADTEEDRQLKLKILDIYNKCVLCHHWQA